jgi:6-phosphogluconolactonase (cycloisomerase 2 family)
MRSKFAPSLALLTLFIQLTSIAFTQNASAEGGWVFVMTNRAEGNSILEFRRSPDGSLTRTGEISTRGLGTGLTLDPLQSQGSLSLSNDGKLLLAVNAASGDVSSFVVTSTGLKFGSKVGTGGALPVSVTAFGGLVYVLNQLGIANITGFTSVDAGHLKAIPGSTRALAGGALAQPAEVAFTPDGKQLLVTEKGTDLIDVFEVQGDGRTQGLKPHVSSGHTPFGFAFVQSDTVVVTEAERRLPKAATTSSYHIGTAFDAVSPKKPDGQTAACWVAMAGDFAFVVNTGTANISSYSVDSSGRLTSVNPIAASTGVNTSPIDLVTTSDGQFLYVLKSAVGAVAAYRIDGGGLTFVAETKGLPLSLQGIAAQ